MLDSFIYIEQHDAFLPLDAIVTVFFTLEYILRFYASVNSIRDAFYFVIST
jgi:hypothetical protein